MGVTGVGGKNRDISAFKSGRIFDMHIAQFLSKLCVVWFGTILICEPIAAQAQLSDDPEITRLEAEKKRLQLEADISNLQKTLRENEKGDRKDLTDALPGFEGKTTINPGALDIESHLLAMVAVKSAATAIKGDLGSDIGDGASVIIAPKNDVLSEWQAQLLVNEIIGHKDRLNSAIQDLVPNRVTALLDPGTALAVINGLGGLLRTETTVSPLSLTAINDDLMALALKAELSKSKLSSLNSLVGDMEGNPVFQVYGRLRAEILVANDILRGWPKKPKEKVAQADPLRAQLSETVTFFESITKQGKDGEPSPLIRAAMTKRMIDDDSKLVRVQVIKAGGSAINMDNIGVFFGDDPLRVSAGLVVAWTMEQKNSQRAGYVFCWTAAKSFRRLQNGHWIKKTFDDLDKGILRCRSAGKI
jgi:hypothetical protein|tara:strand:+ start:67 stop:1317 length:1251 start_codon:yes stop_codon:yes gene_type:complete